MTYRKAITKNEPTFKLVNALWEVSKTERNIDSVADAILDIAADIECGQMLANWLADALGRYRGTDIDGLRKVWGAWWNLFQEYYNLEDVPEYWEKYVEDSERFSSGFRKSDFEDVAYRLSQVGLDYQQERSRK